MRQGKSKRPGADWLAARGTFGASAGLTGVLRVAAPACFARLHVIPRLPELLTTHPALDVELALDDRSLDVVHMSDEGLDLVLRMGVPAGHALTARKLAQARRRVVATARYFEGYGLPKNPKELEARPAVIYTRDGGSAAWSFRRDEEEVAVSLAGRLKVSAADGLREAVFAELGFAVASEWIFSPELASGALVTALDAWTLPPISLWAVFPTGRTVNAKARAFADFVESCLASEPTLS